MGSLVPFYDALAMRTAAVHSVRAGVSAEADGAVPDRISRLASSARAAGPRPIVPIVQVARMSTAPLRHHVCAVHASSVRASQQQSLAWPCWPSWASPGLGHSSSPGQGTTGTATKRRPANHTVKRGRAFATPAAHRIADLFNQTRRAHASPHPRPATHCSRLAPR